MSDYLKVLLSLIPIAALAWAVFVWRRDNRRRLTIRQVGSNIENVVLALDVGAAFILNAAITNDSPKLTIVIHHFDLGLLWCDPEFDWLDDPLERVPSSSEYAYGATLIRYRRDMVLNHRRYEQGKLAPGDTIRGLLMGRGMASIPANYRHGEEIQMRLTVLDTSGKRHSSPFCFRIDLLRG